MMGLLLKIILIAIFIYLIYRIFISGAHSPGNTGGSERDIHGKRKDRDDPVQKRIDKANVEDADYKELD
ncbi:MAG: hypothetical protein U5N56_00400 [Candidatus Marinimicrobia bacterium]|nr:hypothetical protein [Candidatus Neomarinimicrobiota bacterium]